ncbi:unnamed protein product [Caretta caretta]
MYGWQFLSGGEKRKAKLEREKSVSKLPKLTISLRVLLQNHLPKRSFSGNENQSEDMDINLFPQERAGEKASIPEIQDQSKDERDNPLLLPPVCTKGGENSCDKDDYVAVGMSQALTKWPFLITEEFHSQCIKKGLLYFQNHYDTFITPKY